MEGQQQLDVQRIEALLQELGDELARRGFTEPVRVLLVGGVYMVTQVGNRRATQDVDVVLMDMADTTDTAAATRETKLLQMAVRAVARKMKIKQHWFNDDAALFVRGFAPDPQARHWKTFNMLSTYLPSKACVLALKIMSYRRKDLADVEALCAQLGIKTREEAQAILDQFVPQEWQKEYPPDASLDEIFEQ
ncbi:hypothetical protein [Ktedonobacter racemifer]|uniref:Uncharacterized protein n=1 Tax=Ktedonobacter racemifer DSM 44963 TaxID=485913 RepID=D6TVF8_KTERA|nr:hypothetical protein [Ktedonobacter racemifer]EFH85361.1 hypothetical protein Krac_6569 [Ktedonobacter racemifer DSM 44963]